MKLKTGLVKQIKVEKEEENKQEKLKEKYQIKEDIKIVEKNHWIKFTLKSTVFMVKIMITMVLFFLALMGTMALIRPETRELIFQNFQVIFGELFRLLG